MKRLVILTVLVATTLIVSSCKSPKGNVNPLGFGRGRPNPVQ
jgi:hypothetical protein